MLRKKGRKGGKIITVKMSAIYSLLILLSIIRVHYIFNASLCGMSTAYKCLLLAELVIFFSCGLVLHQQELPFLKKEHYLCLLRVNDI